MALKMKPGCEKCGCILAAGDDAYICSYECTFCSNARPQWIRSVPIAEANWYAGPAVKTRNYRATTLSRAIVDADGKMTFPPLLAQVRRKSAGH